MLELGLAAGIGAGIGALVSFVVADKVLARGPDLTESRLYQWVSRNADTKPRRTKLAVFVVTATIIPDDTAIIPLAMIGYGWRRIAAPLLSGKLAHTVSMSIVFYAFTQWFAGNIDKGVKTDLSLGLMVVFVLLIGYQAEKVRAVTRRDTIDLTVDDDEVVAPGLVTGGAYPELGGFDEDQIATT